MLVFVLLLLFVCHHGCAGNNAVHVHYYRCPRGSGLLFVLWKTKFTNIIHNIIYYGKENLFSCIIITCKYQHLVQNLHAFKSDRIHVKSGQIHFKSYQIHYNSTRLTSACSVWIIIKKNTCYNHTKHNVHKERATK